MSNKAPRPWWLRIARILLLLLTFFLGLTFWLVQPQLPVSAQPAPSVDPTVLRHDVELLVGQFGQRSQANPQVLLAAAAWIEQQLRAAGGRIARQPYQVDGKPYANSTARFGPDKGPLVVVGAHYDTCLGLPGADDNASGVAALLALGRLFGKRPPLQPVELVAYTLEEPPHFRKPTMGSAVHAQALLDQQVQVTAMVSLEMLGTFVDTPASQSYPAPVLEAIWELS